MQVQLSINRFCANTSICYFLRTMSRAATAAAAATHDMLIERALHRIIGTKVGTEGERARAVAQARLPARMGGMGHTSQSAIAPAATIGSWALCWGSLQAFCPHLFADVDVATSRLPALVELQVAHRQLLRMHGRVETVYAAFDSVWYDVDKCGEQHFRFHPDRLTPRKELLPLAELGSGSEFLQHAQSRWSQIIHHSAWLGLLARLQGVSVREATRFISVSQPDAGAFLNAVPKWDHFRMHTWAMRIAVQRRLGLPLSAVWTASRSRHGQEFDRYGDVAQSDGDQGHQTRHFMVLQALARVARSVWGGRVQVEPDDYLGYSDYRPDLAGTGLGREGGGQVWLGECKVKGSIGSSGVPPLRGSMVAFGNTHPPMVELVMGLAERGAPSDGAWIWRTGTGYVARVRGDYDRAIRKHGADVVLLLLETFGGFGPELRAWLQRLTEERQNKLSKREYDDTTWAARTWRSYAAQQISVALHRSCALEIANALGLSGAADERPPA